MNRRFLSSIIQEHLLRPVVLGEAEAQSSVVVANEVQHNAEEEAPFNELAKVEVPLKQATNTMTTVVGGVAEGVGLDGRIMINRSETEILQSTSDLSGQ